jgi:hypothetical protein
MQKARSHAAKSFLGGMRAGSPWQREGFQMFYRKKNPGFIGEIIGKNYQTSW